MQDTRPYPIFSNEISVVSSFIASVNSITILLNDLLNYSIYYKWQLKDLVEKSPSRLVQKYCKFELVFATSCSTPIKGNYRWIGLFSNFLQITLSSYTNQSMGKSLVSEPAHFYCSFTLQISTSLRKKICKQAKKRRTKSQLPPQEL